MTTNSGRSYRQTARAAGVRGTRERILNAAQELFFSQYFEDVTLQGVAGLAEVTVQTVLRHFVSKEGLLAATIEHIEAQVTQAHEADQVDQGKKALLSVLRRYELMGDGVTRVLAQEGRVEPFAQLAQRGRDNHRAWLEKIFAPRLPTEGDPLRERRVLQLLLLFDVFSWRLIRRDHGADFATMSAALVELLELLIPPKEAAEP